ncbi:LOW QUALITY PROTEIN: aminoadipate-semialdehyde dehydrogenase [Tachypleus tridentatus]|uniref:LOW QUALITY PROTEIN: aminoadipate-semialdehyde dehydrogenase n=1 Tax=Tachypleus tridentatus TaxID=6853 RepID=UPI003FCF49C7
MVEQVHGERLSKAQVMNKTLNQLVEQKVQSSPSNVALIYSDGEQQTKVTYQELAKLSSSIAEELGLLVNHPVELPVLCICKQSILAIVILLSVLKSSFYFTFLDLRSPLTFLSNLLNVVQLDLVIAEKNLFLDLQEKCNLKWMVLKTLQTPVGELMFLRVRNLFNNKEISGPVELSMSSNNDCQNDHLTSKLQLAYLIQTSGTTGIPKVVKVPHSCIIPNILHLRSLFSIDEKDIVLLISPFTFDPSMVEVFISLSSGASLLIVPDFIKTMPAKVARIVQEQKVSVLQATPSLLQKFGKELLQKELLHFETPLRVLALGGEKCPSTRTLMSWKGAGNRTEIYNIYGITEVSCWATLKKITESDLNDDTEVPLGLPLLETEVVVKDKEDNHVIEGEGELFVGGENRICLIDNEKHLIGSSVLRATGDWVRRTHEGNIMFLGRVDSVVKYNGKKVNLALMQDAVEQLVFVNCSVVIYHQHRNIFCVCLVPITSRQWKEHEMKERILGHLKHYNVPLDVLFVPHIPTTAHGKVNSKVLLDYINSINSKQQNICRTLQEVCDRFTYFWKVCLTILNFCHLISKVNSKVLLDYINSINSKQQNICRTLQEVCDRFTYFWKKYTGMKDICKEQLHQNSYFMLSGGDSVTAVQCVQEIEWELGISCPLLVDKLLNTTFSTTFQYLWSCCKQKSASSFVETKLSSNQLGKRKNENQSEEMVQTIKKDRKKTISLVHSDTVSCDPTLRFQKGRTLHNPSLNNSTKSSISVLKPLLTVSTKNKVNVKKLFSEGNEEFSEHSSHHCEESNMLMEGTTQQLDTDNSAAPERKEDHLAVQRKNKTDPLGHNTSSKYNSDNCILSTKLLSPIQTSSCFQVITRFQVLDKCLCSQCHWSKSDNKPDLSQNVLTTKLSLMPVWTYNLHKCIDASPLLIQYKNESPVVFIGSHSGWFVAVAIDMGCTKWKVKLPSRVESSACSDGLFVAVGCYDNFLYVLDVQFGSLWWKVKTAAEVKCSPVVDSLSGYFICGSHDHNLYALNIEKKVCVWHTKLSEASIFASPSISKDPHQIYVAALDGSVAAVTPLSGCTLWQYACKKPVFSTPLAVSVGVCVASVSGEVVLLGHDGNMIWKFQCGGPVFSSISYCRGQKNENAIIFGCHDNSIYCVSLKNGTLIWKFEVNSPVFSTPCVAEIVLNVSSSTVKRLQVVTVSSTSGYFYVLSPFSGKLITSHCFPGEIFSSPVMVNNQLLLGCRDNSMYCVEIVTKLDK